MSFFERLFDFCSVLFGGIFGSIERAITSIFGSANARHVARLQLRAEAITELEPKYAAMSDEELRKVRGSDFEVVTPPPGYVPPK